MNVIKQHSRLASILLAFLIFFIIQPVYSAEPAVKYTIDYTRVVNKSSGTLKTIYRGLQAANDARPPAANDARYATRISTLRASSIAARLRNAVFKRNALGLVVTGIVGAVGWAIGEIKQDLYGNNYREIIETQINSGYKHPESNELFLTKENAVRDYADKHFSQLYDVQSTYNITCNGNNCSFSVDLLGKFPPNLASTIPYNNVVLTEVTGETTRVISDAELNQAIEDNAPDFDYNKLFNDQDFIDITSEEKQNLYRQIFPELYPEVFPQTYVPTAPVIVPGTAPEVPHKYDLVYFPGTAPDTVPNTDPLTDPTADPSQPTLPNGDPNPNYDPRYDPNHPDYDPTLDPKNNPNLDPATAPNQKTTIQLLRQIRDQQTQQLKEQQELQDQTKGLNREKTQTRIRDILAEINEREKAKEKEDKQDLDNFNPNIGNYDPAITAPDRKEFDANLITDFKNSLDLENKITASGGCGLPFNGSFQGQHGAINFSGNVDAFCRFETEWRMAGVFFLAFMSFVSIRIVLSG